MPRGPAYSEAPGGPIQRAFTLRIRGVTYEKIVERLRAEYPECAGIKDTTVYAWGRKRVNGGTACRLSWDEIIGLFSQERDQQMIGAANPQAAARLAEVRELIGKVRATILGEDGAIAPDDLTGLKIRPDTFLVKLYAEERALTRSDLLGVPRRSIQRVVLLVLHEMAMVLTEMGLVPQKKIQAAAAEIADEVIRRMPDVLATAAAQEATGVA